MQKLTNGQDADDPNGDDVPLLIPSTDGLRTDDLTVDSAVRWTYIITNTGSVDILEEDVRLIESDTSLTPALDRATDVNGDGILSVGESWTYVAESVALDLTARTNDFLTVSGCLGASGNTSSAYRNVVTVNIGSLSNSDPSHYCTLQPTSADTVTEPADPLWTKPVYSRLAID